MNIDQAFGFGMLGLRLEVPNVSCGIGTGSAKIKDAGLFILNSRVKVGCGPFAVGLKKSYAFAGTYPLATASFWTALQQIQNGNFMRGLGGTVTIQNGSLIMSGKNLFGIVRRIRMISYGRIFKL